MESIMTITATRPQLSYLADQMNELKQKGTHFKLRVLQDAQAPECTVDGKHVINLASNNYLGLTTHPKLREAAIAATKKYGVGSGAVRTVSGTMSIHMELEEKIARFKNTEACVVFQSGFAANAGTVSAILGKDDFIISDELNHASIIDGARLSRAKIKVFRHKDTAHAEELLKEVASEPGHKLIITDGVFSMDGDIGPLPALCDLAEKYGAIISPGAAVFVFHFASAVGGGNLHCRIRRAGERTRTDGQVVGQHTVLQEGTRASGIQHRRQHYSSQRDADHAHHHRRRTADDGVQPRAIQ
jgi:glycine C-acetyltransferase